MEEESSGRIAGACSGRTSRRATVDSLLPVIAKTRPNLISEKIRKYVNLLTKDFTTKARSSQRISHQVTKAQRVFNTRRL
jgi:hypothetical protein